MMNSDHTPLVSLIVPVYNVEKYIRQCIDSIVCQSYSNLEIILVDDGSPDKCGEIINEYAATDKRIIAIHQDNHGLSAARNAGIIQCTGEYITFVDSDDWIEQNYVMRLMEAVHSSGKDIVMCDYTLFHDTYDIKSNKQIESEPINLSSSEAMHSTLSGKLRISVWGRVYTRKLFSDDVIFPVDRSYEDTSIIFRLISLSNGICSLNKSLYYYRIRSGSITRTRTMDNIHDRWVAEKELLDSIDPADEELKRLCIRRCLLAVSYAWRWSYGNGGKEVHKYWQMLGEMSSFVNNNKKIISSADFNITQRVALSFAGYLSNASLRLCYTINQMYRRMCGKKDFI